MDIRGTNATKKAARSGLRGAAMRLAVAGSMLGCCAAGIQQPVHAAPGPQSAATPAQAPDSAPSRPNLLVIMGDDIGYSDIGAYGGNIDTPNLDELARHSIKFTNFYNMSRCCPSRAALLTGRYPHRVNMAGNGTSLSLEVPTVAEELRDSGYATSMVGKWHLTAAKPIKNEAEHLKWLNHQGHFDRDFGDRRTYPAARGFDHHWGIIWGVADYYDPFSLVDDFTPVKSVPKDFYLTDAITDHAVQQINTLAHGRKPFMMYLAYTAAHWPLMAPEKVIQKYITRFSGGWNALRRQRYEKQVELGLIAPGTELPPVTTGYAGNADIAWNKLTPEQRKVQIRKMATHAAMIDIMDQGIGRVIQALKDSGQYDNTVVMFLVDNGASPEVMTRPGYDRPSETRDGRKIRYGEYPEAKIGTELTMAGIGTQWASAANTPWRYWKREQYQGGTHTPFLFSWPGHMGDRAGTKTTEVAHIIDVTPTLLDLAGTKPHLKGKPPIDGVSFAGVLKGQPVERSQPLFFEHYAARGILDGNWKMVSLAPNGRRKTYRPWHLYDMKTDRTEMHDVSAQHPEVAARLNREWLAWAQDVGVDIHAEPTEADRTDD
ncbi:arylsulfatase [Stakelama saccharophila]|uniref:Arylsulfatase n=1 Tax=Stakelama saccharophila TaxID=3075605 RepID=A0ABZ0B812_9SPHN|nr:arylsulfatase [Stakelama sp. W311]WNO53570.1 arylsulfatase [Stakelama sp. W311]